MNIAFVEVKGLENFYKLVLTFLICSIISEHIKSRLHAGRRPNTFFWRNSTGHEIDLIIGAGAQLWAVEIKSGKTLNEVFFKGLRYFKRLSSAPEKYFYLVYGGKRDFSRKHGQVLGWKSISKLSHI